MIWHLIHSCAIFAHELPDIHLRLHFVHLYSPKHRFFPWYGVRPSFFFRAYSCGEKQLKKSHKYVYKTKVRSFSVEWFTFWMKIRDQKHKFVQKHKWLIDISGFCMRSDNVIESLFTKTKIKNSKICKVASRIEIKRNAKTNSLSILFILPNINSTYLRIKTFSLDINSCSSLLSF